MIIFFEISSQSFFLNQKFNFIMPVFKTDHSEKLWVRTEIHLKFVIFLWVINIRIKASILFTSLNLACILFFSFRNVIIQTAFFLSFALTCPKMPFKHTLSALMSIALRQLYYKFWVVNLGYFMHDLLDLSYFFNALISEHIDFDDDS